MEWHRFNANRKCEAIEIEQIPTECSVHTAAVCRWHTGTDKKNPTTDVNWNKITFECLSTVQLCQHCYVCVIFFFLINI